MSKIDSRTRSEVGRTVVGQLGGQPAPAAPPPMTRIAATVPTRRHGRRRVGGQLLNRYSASSSLKKSRISSASSGVRLELRVLADDGLGHPPGLGRAGRRSPGSDSEASRRSLCPFWRAPRMVPSPRSSQVLLGQREAVGRAAPPRPGARWPAVLARRPEQVAPAGSSPRPTRPRSWCSWAMPKRSASSTTITVASGTSTPTSITVVATSTSSSPARKRGHHLLPGRRRHLPVQQPDAQARPARPPASRSYSSVADLASTRSESLDQRADHEGPVAGRHLVAHPVPGLGARRPASGSHVGGDRRRGPGGSSSRTVRSRSPKITMAAVRGIGVAVMTSRSGSPVRRPWPAAPPAARPRSGAARR